MENKVLKMKKVQPLMKKYQKKINLRSKYQKLSLKLRFKR